MTSFGTWFENTRQNPQWVTRPEVDFINAFCPSGANEFPIVPGTEGLSGIMPGLFDVAFRAYQDDWRADLVRVAGVCGKAEMQVLLAIERKTLGFGKLMEKLPRRLLTEGEVDRRTDQPLLRSNGSPILLPTGIHRRNLDRAINGLLEKQLITRVASDVHPRYGASSVYAAAPLEAALTSIVGRVDQQIRVHTRRVELENARDAIVEAINETLTSLWPDEDQSTETTAV